MSQSNESENNPELEVTNGLPQSADEFTQYLRSFRPRAAQVSVDEVCSDLSTERATAPILFPVHAAGGQTSNTQNSFLRMGVAWACGMVMGAAIMALLTTQFQKQTATRNSGLAISSTETDREENRESSDRTSEATAVVNSTRTLLDSDRQEPRYSISLPDDDFLENRPLAVSYRWLKSEMQPDSGRSFDVLDSEPKSSDPNFESSFEINFEPSKPKSQRHHLMKELLKESI
jgi:hypothetical protein